MFGLKSLIQARDYRNYRWFYTSEGKLVVGGKNEQQNEFVVRNFKKPLYNIVHTSAPGSPFMIIQSENPSKKDLEETAVFCAAFSKEWKKLKSSKSKIGVDIFKASQLFKTKNMKIGTFGVRGVKNTLKIRPELVLVIQKGKLRAVPDVKREEKILLKIKPGKLSKEQAAEKIAEIIKDKFRFPISKEEIMQAIPSESMSIK